MKLILLCIFSWTFFISFSQDLPEVKIKYHGSNTRVTYPALVKHLTKENTYRVVYPPKLTYYNGQQHMQYEMVTFAYSDMWIKAKRNSDNPEIYLVIDATGITNLVSKGIRKTANGFVIDYTYNFPCKLVIQDNKGMAIYTIPINTETDVLSAVYFKNSAAYTDMGFVPQYFVTEKEASDYQGATKDLGKHIEKYAMLTAFKEMAKVMTSMYSDYSEKHYLQWGDITDPKGVAEYIELNAAAEQLKQACDLLGDKKTEEALALLKLARPVFEKYASSDNKNMTLPVKNMVNYNLGWVTLLSGDTKKTLELFAQQSPRSDWNTGYGWKEMKTMADFDMYREGIMKKMGK